MRKTEDLIESLARDLPPVRRLPGTPRRVIGWLFIVLPILGLVVLLHRPRPDLAERLIDPRFDIEVLAAAATGVMAAIGAFLTTVPGRGRAALLLPLPPLAIWLASLGEGCLDTWLRSGEILPSEVSWACILGIPAVSIVPGAALFLLLRRGFILRPSVTLLLGALAVGSLAASAMRLFHEIDASLLVLFWQFGTVALMSALAGVAGHFQRIGRRLPPV